MSQHSQPRVWLTASLGVAMCLIALLVPGTGRLAAQGGPIVLDGAGTDWDAGWLVASDGFDVFVTDTGLHPHQAPTYARSGYDAIGLWSHYQASDDNWYFRIDVDGRAGDSDSVMGTEGNLGVGTHGPDQGPLVVPPATDGAGVDSSESYQLGFQCAQGAAGEVASLSGPDDAAPLPGDVTPTFTGLDGSAVYSTTVPGVVEFSFDRLTLFPADSTCAEFWLSAQIGDNNDRVSDDQIMATMVIALDLAVYCPAAPAVAGDQATFTLDYSIPGEAATGVTDVVLVTNVPDGAEFVSASDGGTESGGVITWQLGSLAPGSAGEVTFTALVGEAVTSITLDSEMTSAEGLRFVSSDVCPVQQPTATPTNTPTGTPSATASPTVTWTPTAPAEGEISVVPEPSTVGLMLAGLGTLAGYAGLQWRARRRQ